MIDKCIIAGCPEYVCKKCGKPREKIIETESHNTRPGLTSKYDNGNEKIQQGIKFRPVTSRKITGLTDCGCNAGFEGGTILDPFNGSGTTTLRAEQLGRKWIGIDGSESYSKDAKESLEIERQQLKLF